MNSRFIKRKKLYIILIISIALITGVTYYIFCLKSKTVNRPIGFRINNVSDQFIFEEIGENLNIAKPRGIAVDQRGNIYISDFQKHFIMVFDQKGKVIKTIGKPGSGAGEFLKPVGITIQNGQLYVADGGNARIQILTLDGNFVREIDLKKFDIMPRDIVVLDESIYLTVDSHTPNKHKIYRIDEKNRVSSMGKYQIGYLAKIDKEKIAFINQANFKKAEDGWHAYSGVSRLYYVENRKLSSTKIELPYKYFPKDFFYDESSEQYYIICGMYATINRHSRDGIYLDTIFCGELGQDDLDFITVDSEGIIYFTSFRNGKIYRLRSRD